MNISKTDFDYMVDCLERDVASILVEKDGCSIRQALDALYLSQTYQKIHNPATGLYFQSPIYVYSCLMDEIEEKPA